MKSIVDEGEPIVVYVATDKNLAPTKSFDFTFRSQHCYSQMCSAISTMSASDLIHFAPGNKANRGRPPGAAAQRRLAEAIFGKEGTKEYDEFVTTTRRLYLAGVLPSGVTTLLMNYGWGKVADRIEVEVKNEMEELSEDDLRDRARRLAVATFARPTPVPKDDEPTVQ